MWSHFSVGPHICSKRRANLGISWNISGEVEDCLQGLLSLSSLHVVFCLSDQRMLNRYLENLCLNLYQSPVLLWSHYESRPCYGALCVCPPAASSGATCPKRIPPWTHRFAGRPTNEEFKSQNSLKELGLWLSSSHWQELAGEVTGRRGKGGEATCLREPSKSLNK